MPPAIGTFPPRNIHGPSWRDIRDFGAIPGSSSAAAAATGTAIQAAIDSLAGKGGVVYIPSGAWSISQPIFVDAPNVAIVGEPSCRPAGLSAPPLSSINVGNGMPAFIVGIPRKPNGTGGVQTLSSGYFVDLFGKLDSSAASAPGQRWGIRTNGDSSVTHGTGHFTHTNGSYWSDVRQVTVDFAIDLDLTPNYYTTIFGSSIKGRNYPMTVVGRPDSPGYLQVGFGTAPAGTLPFTAAPTPWSFRIPMPSSGICRVSFQIDLVAATVAAWVNGVQVATVNSLGAGFTPAANLAFPENIQVPFRLGSHGGKGNDPFGDYYPTSSVHDTALYGLRISRALQYANDGVGYYQRRIGQGSASTTAPTDPGLNDLFRYFTVDSNTIGLFPFQNSPSQVIANRVLNVRGYGMQDSAALFIQTNHNSENSSIGGVAFRDLSIQYNTLIGGFGGVGILTGFALDLTVERCSIFAGSQAIGTWNWGSNYTTRIVDCSLGGGDVAYYNYYGVTWLSRLTVYYHGRSTFWFTGGTHNLRDAFGYGFTFRRPGAPVPGAVVPRCMIIGQNGADLSCENVALDLEDGSSPWPALSYVYMESAGDVGGIGGRFRMKGIAFNLGPADIPMFLLHTSNPLDPPATAEIDVTGATTPNFSTLVQTDGPAWHVKLVGRSEDMIFPRIKNTGATPIDLDAVETGVVLPRHTAWVPGYRTRPCGPADGQVSEWICVRPGQYGTSNPPLWAPMTVADAAAGPTGVGSNSLAAYAFDHGWISAGAGTREGFFADYAQARWLAWLLTGAAAAPPTAVYAALGRWSTSRTGWKEISGGGYARVQIAGGAVTPAFAPSSGGATSNALAITFPTATADWTSVMSLFLIDGSNNLIAAVNFDPIRVASGTSLSLAPGTITVAGSASGFYRAVTDSYRDQFNNLWLRGASLPAAPTPYLALSTAVADVTRPPTEPVGNSYARAPMGQLMSPPTSASRRSWSNAVSMNSGALTLPAPGGPWGTVRSVYLMDAPSGGNVIAAANLAVPRAPDAGGAAPAFAPGALWVTRS